ncbi:MAG: hypothetical protein N7Q72_04475 [Spiroplasma sp. Tabriz.8]|nr:hypothetical protein [Spiroplasma sp. Tabriz.8]
MIVSFIIIIIIIIIIYLFIIIFYYFYNMTYLHSPKPKLNIVLNVFN